MKSIMVLVADSSRARVFTTRSPSQTLEEIKTFVSPMARLRPREIVSDLSGRNSGGVAGHAYENEVEPHQQETIKFAKEVSDYMNEECISGNIRRLLIVAAPAFLGELRKHILPSTHDLIVFELAKDLTQHSIEDIRGHLPKYLSEK